MNIAIACRGVIRSPGNNIVGPISPISSQWCVENLDILKESLRGHNVSVFFSSWSVPGSLHFLEMSKIENFSLMRQPTIDEAFEILPTEPIWLRDPSHNCHRKMGVFGFFCQSRAVMNLIESTGKKFDYIIATRPDLRIRIGNINEWMNDKFMVAGVSYTHFNDHFNVAKHEDMVKVFTQPIDVLEPIVNISRGCEDTLKNLVKSFHIEYERNYNTPEYNVRGFDALDNYRRGGYDQYKDE